MYIECLRACSVPTASETQGGRCQLTEGGSPQLGPRVRDALQMSIDSGQTHLSRPRRVGASGDCCMRAPSSDTREKCLRVGPRSRSDGLAIAGGSCAAARP